MKEATLRGGPGWRPPTLLTVDLMLPAQPLHIQRHVALELLPTICGSSGCLALSFSHPTFTEHITFLHCLAGSRREGDRWPFAWMWDLWLVHQTRGGGYPLSGRRPGAAPQLCVADAFSAAISGFERGSASLLYQGYEYINK